MISSTSWLSDKFVFIIDGGSSNPRRFHSTDRVTTDVPFDGSSNYRRSHLTIMPRLNRKSIKVLNALRTMTGIPIGKIGISATKNQRLIELAYSSTHHGRIAGKFDLPEEINQMLLKNTMWSILQAGLIDGSIGDSSEQKLHGEITHSVGSFTETTMSLANHLHCMPQQVSWRVSGELRKRNTDLPIQICSWDQYIRSKVIVGNGTLDIEHCIAAGIQRGILHGLIQTDFSIGDISTVAITREIQRLDVLINNGKCMDCHYTSTCKEIIENGIVTIGDPMIYDSLYTRLIETNPALVVVSGQDATYR